MLDSTHKYSDEGYVPDWTFMEKYIMSLHYKPLSTANSKSTALQIDKSKWKEFRLGDYISEPYKAKAINKDDLTPSEEEADSIRYITRTGGDNGCEMNVIKSELSSAIIEEPNAITIGDTTATCFYQDKEFVAGDHIVVVRAESWMNKFTGLFIVALLQYEQFRYSYGRAYLMEHIKETKLLLPENNGKPDWLYMENYMKSLPYGDRL